jgi:hypothetical protein
MANYFKEDEARPIVSAWIEQGFEIDRNYILEAIEHDESALSQDVMLSGVAAFGSIASGCLMLALAGFSAPMLIPVAVLAGSGLVAWNSDCAKGDRELEAKFLRDYPQTFDRISQRVSTGEGVATIAAEYGQLFRAYRKSDRAALMQLSAPVSPETQTQSGIPNPESQDAPRTESQALAQTELQPIAPGVAAAAPSMQISTESESIPARDIATDLGNNPQSALIFGTPGAGKGMNISNAIRAFRLKYPNVTIFMVDPKGDPKERGYWANQVDTFESKPILKVHPRAAAEWMLDCIDKFRRLDGPKLLIWDELYATVTVLKSQNVATGKEPFPCLTDFQSFLATHLSLGPSSGIWVWGMSPSANLADLGLTSGGLSTTRIIALVSPDNTGAIEGLYATKAIAAPKGGMDTIEKLMEESPVGRACYDGKTKRWYPMARLENHSGFDRDNADWNNLGKVAPETQKMGIGRSDEAIDTAGEVEEEWEADTPIPIADLPKLRKEREARVRIDSQLVKIHLLMEQSESLSIKDIQKKLKLDTSTEAQQLAQMFCLREKSRYQFKTKNNPNSTVSHFIETVA